MGNTKKVKENKEVIVRVRFTPSEHKILLKKSGERLLPMSSYIRMKTMGEIKV